MRDGTWARSALTAIVLGAWMMGCSAADDGGTFEPSDRAAAQMVLAGASWRSGVAVAYEAATSTVDVATPDGSALALRYTDDTTAVFIGDPEDFPLGFCRTIAKRWDAYILSGEGDDAFRRLLGGSADHSCRLRFQTAGAANADGSFDLAAVEPVR